MSQYPVHFILTGGTIDFSYDPASGRGRPNDRSAIPDYIEHVVKPNFPVTFETVSMVDSVDICDEIRADIAAAIERTEMQHVLVTHGTDTMPETAEYLLKQVPANQIVVLTGAMIPFRDIARSDGGFNLGFALASLQALEPGVYIAMNAQVFAAGSVQKNREQAIFEAV